MSKEHASAFIERMWLDDEFSREVMGIDDVKTKLSYISSEGFDFTVDELKHAQRERAEAQ